MAVHGRETKVKLSGRFEARVETKFSNLLLPKEHVWTNARF
jgi:hypothetical protein